MRRRRTRALGALVVSVVVAAGITAGIGAAADAVPPSATVAQAAVDGSPSAIACDKFLDGKVTITGHAGTVGQATDVILVLDTSGSMGSPSTKFTALKDAAKAALVALDTADGHLDQVINGNRVGIVRYANSTGVSAVTLGSSYTDLFNGVDRLPAPNGASPHDAGINAAVAALASSPNKAIVLITDGEATGTLQTNTGTAAGNAKSGGARIVSIGINANTAGQTNLKAWASDPLYFQSGTPAPVDKTKLVADLGALVSTPASFAVTVAPATNFSLGSPRERLARQAWTVARSSGREPSTRVRPQHSPIGPRGMATMCSVSRTRR